MECDGFEFSAVTISHLFPLTPVPPYKSKWGNFLGMFRKSPDTFVLDPLVKNRIKQRRINRVFNVKEFAAEQSLAGEMVYIEKVQWEFSIFLNQRGERNVLPGMSKHFVTEQAAFNKCARY